MEKFQEGKLWGLCCTDLFRMVSNTLIMEQEQYLLQTYQGIDLSDIEIIIQWKMTCNLDALWQRFGHAAQGAGSFGIVIFEFCSWVRG